MHVPRIVWISRNNRVNSKSQCICKICKLAVFMLLLFALYYELSTWDGIVDPEENFKLRTAEDIKAYTKLFLEYGYNAWLAERLPLRRELPDMRDSRCLNIKYDQDFELLNSVSIVVIFRNEKLETLLRMFHSLRDRTNMTLISELIVINDYSDTGFWLEKSSRDAFDAYLKHYITPNLQIFHMEDQMGLMRARRFAVRYSNFDIIIFVDANVEFTDGWLEPMLTVLNHHEPTLVSPQIDRFNEQTLEYVRIEEQRGVFDWTLRRREVPLLRQQLKDMPNPFETPVPNTVVFGMDADLFNSLIHFDEDLNSPAAFELQLSFYMWLQELRIVQVPCSRVAHLQPSDRSYLQRNGNMQQMAAQLFSSYKRLVEIWLYKTKYKSFIYENHPQIKNAILGNISDVEEEYEYLPVLKSFDWYLENVAPDLLQHFPLKARTDFANGTLRPTQQRTQCLTGDLQTNRISLMPCDPSNRAAQHWTLSDMNDLRLGDNHCVEVQSNRKLALSQCTTLGGPQNWHFDLNYNNLISNTLCLEVHPKFFLMVRTCSTRNEQQKWYFEHMHKDAIKANNFY
ncbi:putative inactive polypeptide N-acetylgalactosaminyltransferase 12 [Drosophila sulfurigaster albostrigata]|uniref:putative inactive polypeptide N-acetylgalactosaminyltransferase 12 n=1 Tax=Drosophila sulfurigaster albostrigata TaxID=89887 RepID=UPI002D21AC3C|nr:putative inactive polypeptide N-acetylgalactosaminyltransferase 12 [Drosophila sulfurigaster albostrigata]